VSSALAASGVSPEELAGVLAARADDLAGDVFDALYAMGDFEEFVSTMAAYREQADYERRRAAAGGGDGGDGGGGGGGGGGGDLFAGLAPVVTSLERPARGGLGREPGGSSVGPS
jgi:hypothetical protein